MSRHDTTARLCDARSVDRSAVRVLGRLAYFGSAASSRKALPNAAKPDEWAALAFAEPCETMQARTAPLKPLYERDFSAWCSEQADAVRRRRWESVDVESVSEELDTLGRAERRRLESYLERLLTHLLTVRYQPERCSRSRNLSIAEHARRIAQIIAESPSLKGSWNLSVRNAYKIARIEAAQETHLELGLFAEKLTAEIEADLARALADNG